MFLQVKERNVDDTDRDVKRFNKGDKVMIWALSHIVGQAKAQEHCIFTESSNVSRKVGVLAVKVASTASLSVPIVQYHDVRDSTAKFPLVW